jgi:hypothetical protein
MRKVTEISFPISVWPHLWVQLITCCLYVFLLRPEGYFPSISERLTSLVTLSGWYLPIILWLMFVLLLGELAVRKSQSWAVKLAPQSPLAFRTITFLFLIVLMHSLFVLLECVLFWVVAARYPLGFAPMRFYEGLWRTWLADAPLLLLFGIGEVLRQFFYRHTMREWQVTTLLRSAPRPVNEDEMR